MIFAPIFDRTPEISYGFFRQQLEAGNIANIDLQGLKITGEFKDPPLDPSGQDRSPGRTGQAGQEVHDHAPGHRRPGRWTT